MKRSANRRRSPAAEQRKKQRREQLVKFLRLNTWLVLLAVLVLPRLNLLHPLLAGGRKPKEFFAAEESKREDVKLTF